MSTSVFDLNVLTQTTPSDVVNDAKVQTMVTPNTKGIINSLAFLQYAVTSNNNLQTQNTLMPGNEQHLIVDAESSTISGNLSTYIAGSTPSGASQPIALQFTIGQNWQALVQGVNFETKKNQTGMKEVFWDDQVTTNKDQVKVSYFLPTAEQHNEVGRRTTFGQETLIQWGNRLIQRYSNETNTFVGHTKEIVHGNATTHVHGDANITHYGGVSIEAVVGGMSITTVGGAKILTLEGLYGIIAGASMILHLYFGGFQVIGGAGSVFQGSFVQDRVRFCTAYVKWAGGRVGTGVLNFLTGGLFGTPRL